MQEHAEAPALPAITRLRRHGAKPQHEAAARPAVFQAMTRRVPNRHDIQLALDFGNEAGPWVVVTVNETAYCLGYLPKGARRGRAA